MPSTTLTSSPSVEYLLISQRIHRTPESLIFVSDEFLGLDQPIKRLQDQFLSVTLYNRKFPCGR